MQRIRVVGLTFALLASAASGVAQWPGFRGPGALPTSDNEELPLEWSSSDNVEWSVEVPGLGWSSPIVVDGLVFLTTALGADETKAAQLGTEFSNEYIAELREQGLEIEEVLERHNERYIEQAEEAEIEVQLRAYSLHTGELAWVVQLFAGAPPGGRHAKNSFASETPVSDGQTIFAYIANRGLWAIDLRGQVKWRKSLDAFSLYLEFGNGSSPALTDAAVVVLNDNQEHQFLAAFDKTTGRELWRTPRNVSAPGDSWRKTGWTSPFVWVHDKGTEIVALGPFTAVSYDPRGRELWRFSGHSLLPVPSPFAYHGRLYLSSGVHGDSRRPLTALLPGGRGDLSADADGHFGPHVAWHADRVGPYIPTPVAYNGGLWVLYDRGILARFDAATGERTFRERITGSAGAFTASPWAYRGRVFALDEEGTTFVFDAGTEFQQLGSNPLDEMALASPALAEDRLILRTQSRLYSIRSASD